MGLGFEEITANEVLCTSRPPNPCVMFSAPAGADFLLRVAGRVGNGEVPSSWRLTLHFLVKRRKLAHSWWMSNTLVRLSGLFTLESAYLACFKLQLLVTVSFAYFVCLLLLQDGTGSHVMWLFCFVTPRFSRWPRDFWEKLRPSPRWGAGGGLPPCSVSSSRIHAGGKSGHYCCNQSAPFPSLTHECGLAEWDQKVVMVHLKPLQ